MRIGRQQAQTMLEFYFGDEKKSKKYLESLRDILEKRGFHASKEQPAEVKKGWFWTLELDKTYTDGSGKVDVKVWRATRANLLATKDYCVGLEIGAGVDKAILEGIQEISPDSSKLMTRRELLADGILLGGMMQAKQALFPPLKIDQKKLERIFQKVLERVHAAYGFPGQTPKFQLIIAEDTKKGGEIFLISIREVGSTEELRPEKTPIMLDANTLRCGKIMSEIVMTHEAGHLVATAQMGWSNHTIQEFFATATEALLKPSVFFSVVWCGAIFVQAQVLPVYSQGRLLLFYTLRHYGYKNLRRIACELVKGHDRYVTHERPSYEECQKTIDKVAETLGIPNKNHAGELSALFARANAKYFIGGAALGAFVEYLLERAEKGKLFTRREYLKKLLGFGPVGAALLIPSHYLEPTIFDE